MTRSLPRWRSGRSTTPHDVLNLLWPICDPSVLGGVWGRGWAQTKSTKTVKQIIIETYSYRNRILIVLFFSAWLTVRRSCRTQIADARLRSTPWVLAAIWDWNTPSTGVGTRVARHAEYWAVGVVTDVVTFVWVAITDFTSCGTSRNWRTSQSQTTGWWHTPSGNDPSIATYYRIH